MKKGGKKKGGKKKDGALRKKKSNVPEMTWKEALLAYDISLKEKIMEDVQYELKQTKDLNLRLKSRNTQLKVEQEEAIAILLKANKDFERMLNSKDVVTKEHVVRQMKLNWDTRKDNEQQLSELEARVHEKSAEIEACQQEVKRWEEYRDRGQFEHEKTIRLLGQEMEDMDISFQEISEHLQSTLSRAKEEIEKSTSEILDRQKYIATEKAIAKMDKYSRREVIDNDWLTRETEIHRRETAELFKVVETLEEENLRILSELFECQVEDLHISRNFFMTQFADNDNLGKNTLLEIDLDEMVQTASYTQLKPCAPPRHSEMEKLPRPKSAIQQAIEEKMFLLEQLRHKGADNFSSDHSGHFAESASSGTVHVEQFVDRTEPRELHDEHTELDDFDGANGFEGSDDGDPFLEFHHFDDDDFDDYLKLGPLELKLLNVAGQQMPIHKPPTPPDELLRAKESRPDTWPVTYTMLRNALHQRSPREPANTQRHTTPRDGTCCPGTNTSTARDMFGSLHVTARDGIVVSKDVSLLSNNNIAPAAATKLVSV